MKVETIVAPGNLSDVPQAARQAEELGYDGVVTVETGHDPFLPLALAAEHTERITLGTAVAIAFPRSPMAVAQIAWDLQALSRGRLLLGLGTQVKGHIERRYSTPWTAPGPRLREYILCLRAIWDCWQNGTTPSFQGEHYTFTLMTPYFNPGPIEHPHIPIYISAVNAYNCRLAGELCDGIRLHAFNTPKYLQEVILPNMEKGARKAGRSLKDLDISGGTFIVTGANQEEIEQARRATKQQISFYGSTRTYKPVMDLHGWGDTCLKLNALSLQGRWQEMADEITDEMLEQFAVIGTYDQIVERIKGRLGGIVTTIGFAMPLRSQADREKLRAILQTLRE
ncbi:MAG: TIGR03617 family F420-dependent LLM class oxidoreductase [Dehalococcoidia bacterium]